MIRILLLTLLAGGAVLALRAQTERLLAVPAVARFTERARRLPMPVLFSQARVSEVRKGSYLGQLALHAKRLEGIELGDPSPVVALVEQGAVLWAGTFDNGLFRIEGSERRAIAVDPRINDLALDARGNLIAATGGGAFEVTPAGEVHKFAEGPFTAVAEWRGQTWLASRRGLAVREERGGLWTRGAAQGVGADLVDVLADCGSALCLGANDGLWLFDGERAHRSSSAGELPAEWVTALATSKEDPQPRDGDKAEPSIWAGTFDGGIARIDHDGARRFSDALPERRIGLHALAVGAPTPFGHPVYAGTPQGLLAADDRGAALLRDGALRGGVTAVIVSAQGGLWVGTEGEVQRIELVQGAAGPDAALEVHTARRIAVGAGAQP